MAQAATVAAVAAERPFYFVSYSTGEPQISFFVECLQIVLGQHFDLSQTPASLESGTSQHDAILNLIGKASFGVVCLDGLRPNVVFEYGIMRGANIPLLLFKEESSKVDIVHFFGKTAGFAVDPPLIDLDKHFSDTKDRFYNTWNRFQVQQTVMTIWKAYCKARNNIKGSIEIPEPKLCT